ncbi:hypothetical protein ASD00_36175 [Ensifer sp. Root31]|uniref:DUF4326 domain-containing protein n=1 Tax=Ensifer sp. Root31 TaxID=1736512 RepID=UPI00070D53E5|nr:hypothetical protein ASD00_36175 [Ensifer sp. Root31]
MGEQNRTNRRRRERYQKAIHRAGFFQARTRACLLAQTFGADKALIDALKEMEPIDRVIKMGVTIATAPEPVRLQLSRSKGFNLQRHSVEANGLPAFNVARPSRYGNPVTQQDFIDLQGIWKEMGRKPIEGTWQQHAVRCFDAWLGGEIAEMGKPPTAAEIRRELKGKNLACWCKPGEPCHADILLEIANSPAREEMQG